jgi:hypothetical protein
MFNGASYGFAVSHFTGLIASNCWTHINTFWVCSSVRISIGTIVSLTVLEPFVVHGVISVIHTQNISYSIVLCLRALLSDICLWLVWNLLQIARFVMRRIDKYTTCVFRYQICFVWSQASNIEYIICRLCTTVVSSI